MRGEERYKDKFKTVGLSISDDPCSPSHAKKFQSDISSFQRLSMDTYYLSTLSPGQELLLKEKLLSWKHLEVFNQLFSK